jgi:hypothetical protein
VTPLPSSYPLPDTVEKSSKTLIENVSLSHRAFKGTARVGTKDPRREAGLLDSIDEGEDGGGGAKRWTEMVRLVRENGGQTARSWCRHTS